MPECIKPVVFHDANGKEQIGICGKCENCRKKRVSEWSFRLMQHEKKCDTAYFITLTYDTTTVPITDRGFMGLNKRDLQLFFKRLRKAQESYIKRQLSSMGRSGSNGMEFKPIKYYAVGEYGGRTRRPHYHIILFNAVLELIQPAWSLGNVHYGEVTGASIGYTLKYIVKPSQVPMHKNDDRSKEFSLMSKGLGADYLTKAMIQWHRSDLENRMYVVVNGDQKVSMPRYYKSKIYENHERKNIGFLALQKMREREYEMASKDRMYSRNKREALNAAARKVKHSLKQKIDLL